MPRCMSKQYWMMKSEPDVYSWDDLVRDGSGIWDGVRNHTAKLNMKMMRVGDEALFYHSNIGKACVGVMTITETAFPDPTAEEGAPWVAVRVAPLRPLPHAVTLAAIKAEPKLADMDLIRLGRLSVGRVKPAEWRLLLQMAGA
jgi:predicted RNA-binding protein with PUA-like domain